MRISIPACSSFSCHFQVSTKDVLGVDMSRLASPPFTYFSLFWRFPPLTSRFPMFLAYHQHSKNASEILSYGMD